MLVTVLNENEILTSMVKERIKQNDGCCPCKIEKNEDTKCMCKEFREQDFVGECHCGLYKKVEVNEE